MAVAKEEIAVGVNEMPVDGFDLKDIGQMQHTCYKLYMKCMRTKAKQKKNRPIHHTAEFSTSQLNWLVGATLFPD